MNVVAPAVKRNPVWVSRDGRRIPVRLMADQHVRNALAMVERENRSAEARAIAALRYAEDAPDGAADAANHEATTVLERSFASFMWALALRQELRRRIDALVAAVGRVLVEGLAQSGGAGVALALPELVGQQSPAWWRELAAHAAVPPPSAETISAVVAELERRRA